MLLASRGSTTTGNLAAAAVARPHHDNLTPINSIVLER
jgi:hypothetical protein